MMRTFLRDLPREIRKRAYPFAIRVIHSKAKLIAAVDQYMFRGGRGNNNRTDNYCPIGQWDVSNIQDFSYVFSADRNPLLVNFNEDLSDWDMSSATNLRYMFRRCRRFNSDVSRWNVANVTNFSHMFSCCGAFKSDVSRWNTVGATDMSFMFRYCHHFNSDVSQWDVSNATNLRGMFDGCGLFNSDVSQWVVSAVTDLAGRPPLRCRRHDNVNRR
jgi:surface protein